MIIEVFLAIIIGICLGTITGLTPALHINLIATLILSLSPSLLKYTTSLTLTIIIFSTAITHTFLDSIPSIFLGAPDDTTILSVLPGHKMLLKGKGYAAVILTIIGSLFALLSAIILTPILIPIVKFSYPIIKKYIAYILILISILLILREKKSKVLALTTFMLAGILGLATLTFPNLNQPLFPLLSGLFGTSILIISLYTKVSIPKQELSFPKIKLSTGLKAISSTIISGSITSFLPGVGPSQAAILGSQITRLNTKGFLILIGGLNTITMAFSLVALYTIDRARTGAVTMISKILSEFTIDHLILFLGCTLITAGIATILALNFAKIFSLLITKVNYKLICLIILTIITITTLVISGPIGLLVLSTATSLGMLPSLKNIGKNHLMGCLLLPVILYFLL